jgi:hypothetical protein
VRPLLFLDVDGVLINYHEGVFGDDDNPLLARVNPAHGPRLLALGCELVWATTWMHDANEAISPRLGLPELPVVEWPDSDPDPRDRLHGKTRELVAFAQGRPFAWVDDEITDVDRDWVAAHHPGACLLLNELDFVALEKWSRTV